MKRLAAVAFSDGPRAGDRLRVANFDQTARPAKSGQRLAACSSRNACPELLDQSPQELLSAQELLAVIRRVGAMDLYAQIAKGCLQELE
jgi:hypothetical protein